MNLIDTLKKQVWAVDGLTITVGGLLVIGVLAFLILSGRLRL
jgi:hypothetical protein